MEILKMESSLHNEHTIRTTSAGQLMQERTLSRTAHSGSRRPTWWGDGRHRCRRPAHRSGLPRLLHTMATANYPTLRKRATVSVGR